MNRGQLISLAEPSLMAWYESGDENIQNFNDAIVAYAKALEDHILNRHDHGPVPYSHEYWIGVDFDGTLAYSIPNRQDPYTLGDPIMLMVNRVKWWLAQGYRVKLFTARMAEYSATGHEWRDLYKMETALRGWCLKHLGTELECTNKKDGLMGLLWDDRAVSVMPDTGRIRKDFGSV